MSFREFVKNYFSTGCTTWYHHQQQPPSAITREPRGVVAGGIIRCSVAVFDSRIASDRRVVVFFEFFLGRHNLTNKSLLLYSAAFVIKSCQS